MIKSANGALDWVVLVFSQVLCRSIQAEKAGSMSFKTRSMSFAIS